MNNSNETINITEEEMEKIKIKASNRGATQIGSVALFSLLWLGIGQYDYSSKLKSDSDYYMGEAHRIDSLYRCQSIKNELLEKKIALYSDSLKSCRTDGD